MQVAVRGQEPLIRPPRDSAPALADTAAPERAFVICHIPLNRDEAMLTDVFLL